MNDLDRELLQAALGHIVKQLYQENDKYEFRLALINISTPSRHQVASYEIKDDHDIDIEITATWKSK